MSKNKCLVCGGDNIERCNNPDHGFIAALSFRDEGRLGCPVCGHDEFHRVGYWKRGVKKWGECEFCDEDGNQLEHMIEEAESFLDAE